MKKMIRLATVLAILGFSTVVTGSQLLGGDPMPTCSPYDPTCVQQVGK